MTGGLTLELLEIEGGAMPAPKKGKGGRYSPRKPARAAIAKRKVVRKRR